MTSVILTLTVAVSRVFVHVWTSRCVRYMCVVVCVSVTRNKAVAGKHKANIRNPHHRKRERSRDTHPEAVPAGSSACSLTGHRLLELQGRLKSSWKMGAMDEFVLGWKY